MRDRELWLTLLAFGCLVSTPLHSQTVHGLVLDDSTSQPIHGAEIMLRDSSGTLMAVEVTDQQGRFEMILQPGQYSFQAIRMGYAPTVTPMLEIVDGSPPIELTVLVPSELIVLEPVVVEGERQPFAPGPLRGFYERERRGWGIQLTREEIEEKVPGQFTDILRGLAGVRVRSSGADLYWVQMVGQVPLGDALYKRKYPFSPRDEQKGRRPDAACPISYYLDGAKYEPGARGINGEVLPHEVEAVEVYRRASETPADFVDSDSRCGVVVIWTKRG